jgi:phospholipid transport system transporter-binding protein
MPGSDSQHDAFVRESEGRVRLQAPLRFATVAGLRHRGLELIEAAGAELTIDLSGVSAADSAGLALLIDWLARARAGHKKLRYVAPPEALRALARLSDVETLITGEDSHRTLKTGS